MRFNRIQQKNIIRAILVGGCTGLIGVALFVFFLQQGIKVDSPIQVPVDVQEPTPVDAETFYATQHGMFSTLDAATAYMKSYPTLNISAVVEIGEQFYIWSEVATTKEWSKATVIPTSFVKTFTVSSDGCPEEGTQKIPSYLKNEAYLNEQLDVSKMEQNMAQQWQQIVQSMHNLTNNQNIIRLHVLAHFKKASSCIMIDLQ